MTRGLSLHIGLNRVDPAHYGDITILRAAENDPVVMERIARERNFETEVLLGSQATTAAVKNAISRAAGQLTAGDIFLITYAGHGAQVPDANGDEAENSNQDDGMDETWCLFDRMLVDDEMYALWARFARGVRIAMFSDSCHSGTVTRMAVVRAANDVLKDAGGVSPGVPVSGPSRLVPLERSLEIFARHEELYNAIQTEHAEGVRVPIEASVILVSACQDNQLAIDGEANGAFTFALRMRWANGTFAGSYDAFRKKIGSLLPVTQSPNYFVTGAKNPDFELQTPFTI